MLKKRERMILKSLLKCASTICSKTTAVDGQNIVSCAFFLIVEKPMSPAFINGRTGMVLNVYTCPSYRRKGCAKMIMEALISEAKKMEIPVIELKATEDGYPLYRSVGFMEDDSKYHRMKWKNR